METNSNGSAGPVALARLAQLQVGEGVGHDRLTVFPVFEREQAGTGAARLDYRTLGEAIAEGWVEVTEQASATVPELVLWNRGKLMAFVLDGEEIVGGRENPIANASFLVAPGTKVLLPVSCVEHGRWHDVSPRFAVGEVSYHSLKRAKHEQVVANLRAAGRPVADQSAIWESVAERQATARVESPTGAMHDIYRDGEQTLAGYERAFRYSQGAIGLVAALGGHVTGADLFDQPRTAEVLWPRLVRSYALDAVDSPQAQPVARGEASLFLTRGADARCEVYPSMALGEDVRFSASGITGSALVYRAVPVHVSLFRTNGAQSQASRETGQIARASLRRSLRGTRVQ